MWLWRIFVNAFAVWIATLFPLDVVVHGGNGSWWGRLLTFLCVALILVLVNALVKPVVKLVTLPVRLLTLGLFALVINWAMLVLTSWISGKLDFATLDVGGFWKTLLAALIISVITLLLGGNRSATHGNSD
jgi:putative membrane protein